MIPFRVIRSAVLLSGLLAVLAAPLHAAGGGFTATLSADQKAAAGLDTLGAAEVSALDRLVAGDLALARDAAGEKPAGSFTTRLNEAERKAAGLDRLTAAQAAKLDEYVDAALSARPAPKPRPRLKDGDVLSETGRLQVHGGVSMTYGTGGGRSFRGASTWVSYYDPVTGLGLGLSYSRYSGDGLYGGYPYYYDAGWYDSPVYYGGSPRMIMAESTVSRPQVRTSGFRGDGGSLRASAGDRAWRER